MDCWYIWNVLFPTARSIKLISIIGTQVENSSDKPNIHKGSIVDFLVEVSRVSAFYKIFLNQDDRITIRERVMLL